MLFRSAGEPARWPPPVAGPVANLFSTARSAAVLCLLLAVPAPLVAQSVAGQPVIRYHTGDNPQWAQAGFDDSGWPIAKGQVPSVAGRGDGFLWVRMRIPVSRDLEAPLALHLSDLGIQPTAWQVFVNGVAIAGQGTFPPQAMPVWPPVSPVTELGSALVAPGSTAVIALREWQAPSFFETHAPSRPRASIDEKRMLDLAVRARAAETLAASAPEDALSTLLALVGILLLFVWRRSRQREYLWAAIFMFSPLATAMLATAAVTSRLSFHEQTLAWAAVDVAGLIAEIEFMWTIFRLRSRPLHILWHALWVAFIAALLGEAWFLGSPEIERLCRLIIVTLIPAFDAILFPVCIRELFRRGGNRTYAAAMCVMEVAIGLAALGYSVHAALGPWSLDLVQLTITLVDLAIAGLLIGRAVRAWREANGLRVEFEAAREVQQQLVTAPPPTPGFHIESAYRPAAQVGGDFYRVLPGPAGEVLVVVGDVSGKGLPAAMTVSAMIGSLRTMAACGPAEILRRLNESLLGSLRSGFVTCLCARIDPSGTVTVANAGHPAPYRNGEEMALQPGLPLGIVPDADYAETTIHLAPGEKLTFVSDGVVEARSASGELFGFERTRAVSGLAADAIAGAAQQFGQEDDITVLTVALAAVPAAATA